MLRIRLTDDFWGDSQESILFSNSDNKEEREKLLLFIVYNTQHNIGEHIFEGNDKSYATSCKLLYTMYVRLYLFYETHTFLKIYTQL